MEQIPENKTCPLCNKSMLQQSFDPLTTTLKWADNEITCHQHCIIDLVLKRIEAAPTNKPEAPMTWEQALEQTSQRRYENTFEIIERLNRPYGQHLDFPFYKEAAQLYAEAAFHRGAREQREICKQPNAPAPEFKA